MYSYALYKFGQYLAFRLPLRLCYAIATFFSDVHFVFANQDRACTWANYRIIFPEKSDKELRRIRLAMFRNFAKYLVDFFRFPMMDMRQIKNMIRVENRHYVDEAMRKKKGVILLTAHIGNWELGGVAMSGLGYPLWAVALPHKSAEVNEFFNSRRKKMGVKVIQFGKAARSCFKVLKEQEMLALVGDRDFSNEAGEIVDFFGKRTYLPKGPAVFAIKTGAPIVPGFVLRNGDDSFVLRFEQAFEAAAHETVPDLIRRYKELIERYIRAYPEQWFMFKKFWIA